MALAYHSMSQQGRLTLVHTVKLKPMIKGTISGRMLSSGISHVAFTPVYSEKTHVEKCWIMIIIGERAKRARHSQVCSIENRGYIYYIYIYIVRANFVLITRKEGGA